MSTRRSPRSATSTRAATTRGSRSRSSSTTPRRAADAAAIRIINTIPSVAYLDFGTGTLAGQNFLASRHGRRLRRRRREPGQRRDRRHHRLLPGATVDERAVQRAQDGHDHDGTHRDATTRPPGREIRDDDDRRERLQRRLPPRSWSAWTAPPRGPPDLLPGLRPVGRRSLPHPNEGPRTHSRFLDRHEERPGDGCPLLDLGRHHVDQAWRPYDRTGLRPPRPAGEPHRSSPKSRSGCPPPGRVRCSAA